MRWFQRSVALSALAITSAAGVASAQAGAAIDVRRPKPVVMLLVDTSGSMERMPGPSTPSTTDDFPACTGNPLSDSTQKNRWAVTLEALTGTFQNFSCRPETRRENKYTKKFDFGYFIPHYNFTTAPGDFVTLENQDSDGVVDAFSQRIKFGLMTFDGVSTTLGGETLVAFDRFSNDQPFMSAVAGSPGIYSYGRTGRLAFPHCEAYGVNAGVRGPGNHEGAMIAVSEDGAGIATVNQDVQRSLLSVRPFGGTPIAAMLDDLKYYLENDDSVRTGGRDVFAECRERYAILITDGAPDRLFRDSRFQCQSTDHANCADGKCECPYATEAELAAELRTRKLLKELLVVAFDVDPEAKAILDEIAQKGGERPSIPASTPAELRKKLSSILGSVAPDAASRSVPQIVDNGLPPYAGAHQYEITAGFRLGLDEDDPWQGLLYRRRYGCSAAAPPSPEQLNLDEAENDFFHLRLDEQSKTSGGRKIVTVVPTPASAARGSILFANPDSIPNADPALRYKRTATDENLKNTYNVRAPSGVFEDTRPAADSSINPSQGEVATSYVTRDFDMSIANTLFGDADGNGRIGEVSDRNKIVRYVRADPAERTPALADIYHSNPVVLPPLTVDSRFINTSDEQLTKFLRNVATPRLGSLDPTKLDAYGPGGRPGVIFVGTNDGVLHAFNLDTWKDKNNAETAGGYEFWGFVPPALFGKLASAAAPTHQEMFDGTPQIRNMLLHRNASTRVGTFGTVLVSALRGAPSYVAMDVTVADQPPKFLWQFSAPAMGLTVATPGLAQARIFWDDASTPRERAIAILPGGQGREASSATCTSTTLVDGKTLAAFPNQKRAKVRCWEQRGRGLYIVDVATGQLIQEFDSQHFPSPLTGSVAVDGEGMDVSRAAYFTDQDGVLWRLSMADRNPSKWLVEPLWDLFHDDKDSLRAHQKGRPSIHPPLLSRDLQGDYVIVVGTGDVDNLVERNNPSDPVRQRLVSLKEERELDNSSGLVFTGNVQANWDIALDPGESVTGPLSLFNNVLYFGSFVSPVTGNACDFGFSRLWGIHYTDTGTGAKGTKPMFPDGLDASNKPIFKSYIDKDFEDSLVLGVSVASDPVCVSVKASDQYSPFKVSPTPDAQITGGQFQIRAIVSGKGGTRAGGSALNQFSQSLTVPSEARVVGWGGSLE